MAKKEKGTKFSTVGMKYSEVQEMLKSIFGSHRVKDGDTIQENTAEVTFLKNKIK